ncbi:unnamed protein product, partial [Ectocarpus sp. 12 AP-2014]
NGSTRGSHQTRLSHHQPQTTARYSAIRTKGALHAAKVVRHLVLTSLRTDDRCVSLNFVSDAFTSRDSCKHCVTASRVLDELNTTWCDYPVCAELGFSTSHHVIYSTTILVTAKK